MATTYLQLDWKSSQLFEYSKTDKEGFEKHETSNGYHYRKYYKQGATGEVANVSVRESKIGQQLQLTLKNEDGYIAIQFSLYDQKGSVDNTYAESLIVRLGNLEKGQTVTVFPYNLDAETQRKYDQETEGREERDKYYDRRAVSLKTEGKKVGMYLLYTGEGDKVIPKVDWKEDHFTKKKKPTASSLEAKNDFLIAELARCVDGHLAYDGNNSSSSTSTSTPKQEAPKEPTMQEEDHDDLPF